MMYWWGDHMNGWGWATMLISLLLFLGLVTAAVVALVRLAQVRAAERQPNDRAPTPQDLLAGRFARGEIDEAEYKQRMDVLKDTAGYRPTSSS